MSLTGQASVVDDLATKRELWNTVVEAWFPDGPEDPDVVLVRVDATSAEYWDSPGGRVASLISNACGEGDRAALRRRGERDRPAQLSAIALGRWRAAPAAGSGRANR